MSFLVRCGGVEDVLVVFCFLFFRLEVKDGWIYSMGGCGRVFFLFVLALSVSCFFFRCTILTLSVCEACDLPPPPPPPPPLFLSGLASFFLCV